MAGSTRVEETGPAANSRAISLRHIDTAVVTAFGDAALSLVRAAHAAAPPPAASQAVGALPLPWPETAAEAFALEVLAIASPADREAARQQLPSSVVVPLHAAGPGALRHDDHVAREDHEELEGALVTPEDVHERGARADTWDSPRRRLTHFPPSAATAPVPLLGELGEALLYELLRWEPGARIAAADALRHGYFSDGGEDETESI
jgi:hypothetical protein